MGTNRGFMGFFAHAWDFFRTNKDEVHSVNYVAGPVYRPPTPSLSTGGTAQYTDVINARLANDIASHAIKEVMVDENGRYINDVRNGLNDCLLRSPNIDQTPDDFFRDLVLTMFEDGVAACVPVETDIKLTDSSAFDVRQLRVGRVISWGTDSVEVEVYNQNSGRRERVWAHKNVVAIIQNPFYKLMNEPNSTVKRLHQKIQLLDRINHDSATGRMDLVIQLPYVTNGDAAKQMAERRRNQVIDQLRDSSHGVVFTEGSERIVQLNRPVENTLPQQIESLKKELYDRLGIAESVFDGTADPQTLVTYQNRAIQPVLANISQALTKTFLTKTAYTQGHRIWIVKDPFKMMAPTDLVSVSETLIKNQIMTPNEIRQALGFAPKDDPNADQLRNPNINPTEPVVNAESEDNQDGKSYEEIDK